MPGFCPELGGIKDFSCQECEYFESCRERKLYEYKCNDCGELFDEDDTFEDDYGSRICPKCESSSTELYTEVVNLGTETGLIQDEEGNWVYPEDA